MESCVGSIVLNLVIAGDSPEFPVDRPLREEGLHFQIEFFPDRINDAHWYRFDLFRVGLDHRVLADEIDDAGNPLRIVIESFTASGDQHRRSGARDTQSLRDVRLRLFGSERMGFAPQPNSLAELASWAGIVFHVAPAVQKAQFAGASPMRFPGW